MADQKIQIRLKAFDCRLIDRSAGEIVETAKRTGAHVRGPIPCPLRLSGVPFLFLRTLIKMRVISTRLVLISVFFISLIQTIRRWMR